MCYKLKLYLFSLLFCFWAAANVFAQATSYEDAIYPLMFSGYTKADSAEQLKKWDELMKYKLFARGSQAEARSDGYGVVFLGQQIYISDSIGYTGSALGDLIFKNGHHILGGPLLFGGKFVGGDGDDTLLTGPTRFKGSFSPSFNSKFNNWFYGDYCFDGGYVRDNTEYGIQIGNGRILSASECASDALVPFIDENLDVPVFDSDGFGVDGHAAVVEFINNIFYIHVPPSLGGEAFNIVRDEFVIENNQKIYVVMPPGGRLTKIFLQKLGGLGRTANTDVVVVEALNNNLWHDDTQKWDVSSPENIRIIPNKEYGGNLLFHIAGDFEMGASEKIIQGTYISTGNILIKQHTHFAGQFLAKNIYIDANFNGDDFRYVPILAAKLRVDANSSLREDHQDIGDTVQLYLSRPATTRVPFRYCFEFPEKSETVVGSIKAHRNDIYDTDIPICADSVFVSSHFDMGKDHLTEPIVLHPTYDALDEKTETFYIVIFDLEGAVYPNGDRQGDHFRFPITIENVSKNPISKDTIVTAIGTQPLKFSSFPAYKADSVTILSNYSVKFITMVENGTLALNGVKLTAGDVVDASKISTLVYTGVQDEYGSPYDSLKFMIINNADQVTSVEYKMLVNVVACSYSTKENNPANVVVNTLPDTKVHSGWTYIVSDPMFTIDENGVIRIPQANVLDYETKSEYDFTVDIVDGTNVIDNINVHVSVIDVNEPPEIKDTVFSVYENEPEGTSVGVMRIFDPDGISSEFRKNVFSLVGGDVDKVTIDPTTGEITTKQVLDYEEFPEEKKYIIVKVRVDDGEFSSEANVRIDILNRLEIPVITIVEVRDTLGFTDVKFPKDVVKLNDPAGIISYEVNGETMPDTLVKNLKEGYNTITIVYNNPSMDSIATKDVVIFVSTAVPEVKVSAKIEDFVPDNIFTVVEQKEEGDTNFYVNKRANEILIAITEPVYDASYTESSKNYTTKNMVVSVVLDSVAVDSRILTTMSKIEKEKPLLNEMPVNPVVHTKYGDDVLVSYSDKVGGSEVTISYRLDAKNNVVDDLIKVSYVDSSFGKQIIVSYEADAFTGIPVAQKSGGVYTITYTSKTLQNENVEISYMVDSYGHVIRDAEDNVKYNVSYTYVNEFGNTATGNAYVVLDLVAPIVKIRSPQMDEIIYSSYTEVDWTVDLGDGKGDVKQDTLTSQGLPRGPNTILRCYRDKAGNISSAVVYVIMKDAKDIEISVEEPVKIVSKKDVEKYYSVHPPKENQRYGVSIFNTKTGHDVETLIGGKNGLEKGSGETLYKGLDGHLGPTLAIDIKVPVVNEVGGLATLDDIVGKDGMVALDGMDAAGGTKVPVMEYMTAYCTADFRSQFGLADIRRANLYKTTAKVKIWVYTTIGSFVDEYTFTQDLNDPDYTNEAGTLTMFFEQKPDEDGYVRTFEGRLYATGAYIYRAEVTLKSELQCNLPPVKDDSPTNKMGYIRKVSEDMLKPFGYKRPDGK